MDLNNLAGSLFGGGQQQNNNNYGQGYNQGYDNQGYPQNGGYPPQGQGYPQNGGYPPQGQGYQQQGQNYQNYDNGPIQPMGQGQYSLKTENELYCKVSGSVMMFALKVSMVAYNGNFKFSKRLLGTNSGNIVGQVLNHIGRKITGENLEIMEVNGQGDLFLADNAQHVTVIDLERSGEWQYVCVESENLLAFTPDCHYGVQPIIGTGNLSGKGMFTSKLTAAGPNAKVAILTNGNPKILQGPCKVDPDCCICWTGPAPGLKLDVGFKTLIGQTSGESYQFEFKAGQTVVIQPYENPSGFSLTDQQKPTTQNRPSVNMTGQGGSAIENGVGNALKGLFR